MSVYVLSALHRERRRLSGLLDALEGRDTPPSVISAVRSARDSLFVAEVVTRRDCPTVSLRPRRDVS